MSRLAEALKLLDPGRLDETSGSGKYTFADPIFGIAMHDSHHVGQIQLLKRLWAARTPGPPG